MKNDLCINGIKVGVPLGREKILCKNGLKLDNSEGV